MAKELKTEMGWFRHSKTETVAYERMRQRLGLNKSDTARAAMNLQYEMLFGEPIPGSPRLVLPKERAQ